MINQYKRLDVFRCNYQSHAKFENRVSVYHVLKVKHCYPQGCLYFQWHCQRLNKGESCIKGYTYMGRLCSGCRYYYDVKVHHQPQIILSESEYQLFLEELEAFEDWLATIEGHEVNFGGTIESVKPRFMKTIRSDGSQVKLVGYLVQFKEGYVDTVHLEDRCYALISVEQQERNKFAGGDVVEFKSWLKLDQGRLIFPRMKAVEWVEKSPNGAWTYSQALVAKKTSTIFHKQPLRCLSCPKGALVDVEDHSGPKVQKRRELFCLEGIADPEYCYLVPELEESLLEEECPGPGKVKA
ncbi:MAG: hypothetical protein ONB05_05915 [candidate division KSB1 bacterium]|nr:hypothetical protein [candidate division KSB1 bacterium]